MLGLFVALGIAILTLLVILIWFVPHLLQQQTRQSSDEWVQLRDVISDMLNEQEVVTMRQGQLGTTVFYLQEQFDQLTKTGHHSGYPPVSQLSDPANAELHQLKEQVQMMQGQIERYRKQAESGSQQDNEAWAYLLSLLAAVMGRIGELSEERPRPSTSSNPIRKHRYSHEKHIL
jgi:hypothetical protein